MLEISFVFKSFYLQPRLFVVFVLIEEKYNGHIYRNSDDRIRAFNSSLGQREHKNKQKAAAKNNWFTDP